MTKLFEADTVYFVEVERVVQISELSAAIQSAFLLSADTALPVSLQGQLSAIARTLRAQMRELITIIFEEGTEDLLEANSSIRIVNAQLKKAKLNIDKAAATIEQLGALVALLDKLLQIAGVVI